MPIAAINRIAEDARLVAMKTIDKLTLKMTRGHQLAFYSTLIDTLTVESEVSERKVG